MTAKELKRIFQKGECLSLDAMRLYNEKKLNKKSMHEVEKHLLECGLCAGAIDGLNPKRLSDVNKLSEHIQRRLAVYMNTPPRVPFFRRFGFAIIALFLLVGGGCSLWYFAHAKKSSENKVADSLLVNSKNQTVGANDNSVSNQSTAFQPTNVPASTVADNQAGNDKNTGKPIVAKMQNLPADLPGQSNTLTVNQGQPNNAIDNKTSTADKGDGGPNSRTENTNPLIHIKNVQVYPPVTLNDKSARKDSKDGQLGRTTSSDASFKLDEMPSYPGGDEALRNYFMNSFKPTAADRAKLTRFATGISFNVNSKTGEVSSPDISFSISPEIDAEILRVINSMPYWNPGKKRGDVQIMIGLTFE